MFEICGRAQNKLGYMDERVGGSELCSPHAQPKSYFGGDGGDSRYGRW